MRLADEVYQQARALIARRLGLHFPEGRQTNLEQGLLQACHAAAVPRLETYLAWLTALPTASREWRRLAGSLTVGETYFFRDRASLAALEQHVLPSLIAAQRAMGILQLRMWSAGCATGEEPYSLAILLDRLLPDRSQWHVVIMATDINPEALAAAQRGLYRAWSLRETPVWLRERYFCRRSAATFAVDPQIRQMVTFVPCNLADDDDLATVPNTSAVDIILCRHVLMYLTPEVQRAVVAQLQRALVPGGWLVVGAVEASAELLRPLIPVTFPGAILFRKAPTAVDRSPASLPPLPEADGVTEGEGLFPQAGDSLTPTFSPYCSARHGQKRRFAPSPLAGNGGTLNCAPSADTVAGNGWDGGESRGGGDTGELSQQHVGRTLLTLSRGEKELESLPDAATMLQQARALADQGCLEPARDLCEAVLALDRLNAAVFLLLATIQHERGAIVEALEALRRAIYLAPHCAPAHFLLGSLLLKQGEYQRGRRAMETVINLLHTVPRDAVVPSSDGLTVGRLLEMAHMSLEAQ